MSKIDQKKANNTENAALYISNRAVEFRQHKKTRLVNAVFLWKLSSIEWWLLIEEVRRMLRDGDREAIERIRCYSGTLFVAGQFAAAGRQWTSD